MADIKTLLPKVQRMCSQLVDKCASNGIKILITQTYRSIPEQDSLYAQGRTRPGKVVTNARGGQSMHNFKVAFDFVIMTKGKPDWDTRNKQWQQVGKIGQSIGLEWGGSWSSFPDLPHFQYTAGYTLSDFQKGKIDLKKFA